eukprot:5428581-Pyramimonas_sp.AAC.1
MTQTLKHRVCLSVDTRSGRAGRHQRTVVDWSFWPGSAPRTATQIMEFCNEPLCFGRLHGCAKHCSAKR